jgi:hypothetical protein
MVNVYTENISALSPLEQKQAKRDLDAAGFKLASIKCRDGIWFELNPTTWLWVRTLRGLKS